MNIWNGYFYDAILGEGTEQETVGGSSGGKYERIGDYKVSDYKERPHQYLDDK